MWPFKPTIDDLREKRAGKQARLTMLERYISSYNGIPISWGSRAIKLTEEIAILDYRIEQMGKK